MTSGGPDIMMPRRARQLDARPDETPVSRCGYGDRDTTPGFDLQADLRQPRPRSGSHLGRRVATGPSRRGG